MPEVRLNLLAITTYVRDRSWDRVLEEWGEQVAEDARQAAPRDTGAMAASIGHEVGVDDKGRYVRVSWSAERFYGLFSEVGTSHESPRPFLRPAAMKRRSL